MPVGDFIRRITVPAGYVLDPMTTGPAVPEGWTGDAWQAKDLGQGYFLRAWNDVTGQVAASQSETSYEEAANTLHRKIQAGGDWLVNASGQR
jgi:hypothetical protein